MPPSLPAANFRKKVSSSFPVFTWPLSPPESPQAQEAQLEGTPELARGWEGSKFGTKRVSSYSSFASSWLWEADSIFPKTTSTQGML